MKVKFELDGPDGSDDSATVRSLYVWLSEDRELGRVADIAPVGDEADADWMGGGGVLEGVLAVLATGATIGQLGLAYSAWRKARRPKRTMTLTVSDCSPEEVQKILDALKNPK